MAGIQHLAFCVAFLPAPHHDSTYPQLDHLLPHGGDRALRRSLPDHRPDPTQCNPQLVENSQARLDDRSGCCEFQLVGTVVNSIADWTYGLLLIFIIRDSHMSCKLKLVVMAILGFAAMYVGPDDFPGAKPAHADTYADDMMPQLSGRIGTVVRIPFICTLYGTNDFLCVILAHVYAF